MAAVPAPGNPYSSAGNLKPRVAQIMQAHDLSETLARALVADIHALVARGHCTPVDCVIRPISTYGALEGKIVPVVNGFTLVTFLGTIIQSVQRLMVGCVRCTRPIEPFPLAGGKSLTFADHQEWFVDPLPCFSQQFNLSGLHCKACHHQTAHTRKS